MHRHIDELADRDAGPSEASIADLRAALEELRMAHQELRHQNEALAASYYQLEADRKRYQELFELAPDAYLVTSLTGIISEANLSACRLFEIAPGCLPGMAFANYITPEDRARFRALLHVREERETRTAPFKLRTRRGERFDAELTFSVVENNQGQAVGFRWLVRDVTDRERLAQQIRTLNAELESRVAERTADLRAAQQLTEDLFHREQAARHAAEASEAQSRHVQKLESIGVLAGGIAHDFNNLLHVVLGNADIALSRLSPRSPARDPLEEVVRATIRAADLTRQMLAYSGKGAFVVRYLDLSQEVREMATLLRTALSKQATLVWELASDLPAVNADATQVRQIVMNLITNASDALRDTEGTITLRTGIAQPNEPNDTRFDLSVPEQDSFREVGTRYVFLEVSDTGSGMTPDTLHRIFDPFFSTKFAGRGLGLAAVMGIVRSHKGLIRIHTEPGRGTSFRVLFPALSGPVGEPEKSSDSPNDWRGNGTVLVVEDEEGVREVAQRMLEDFGFATLPARDGREALEVMERAGEGVTAVLLDLSMPRMGGQEAFRRIRMTHPDLPVILMSGYTAEAVATQLKEPGAATTTFLQKPFLAEDLLGALRRVMETSPQAS